ncbi:MAG: hypothetical protein GX754_01820 [Clostridiaceae bacterium]|nr:hypothetical protein [Clostridiaceae bacterium]
MDWSRVKNILIVVFIILNIFLLVYLYISHEESAISKESVAAVIEILGKNNVIIDRDCEIPTYKKNTPMLVFKNNDIDKKKIIEKLLGKDYATEEKDKEENENRIIFGEGLAFTYHNPNPSDDIDINKIKNMEKYLRDFFSGMGINMSQFILDRHIEQPENDMDTYIFIEKYKNYLVYDNRISVSITPGGIASIELNIRKIKGFTKKASPIMPAHQVLLKNFYKKKDITIKCVDLGYKGFENEYGEQETKEIFHGPAWRIITSDGTEVFLKAYDGEEIM